MLGGFSLSRFNFATGHVEMDDWCFEACFDKKSRGVAQTVNQLAVKTMDRKNREKAKNLFQVSFYVAISTILVVLF